MLSNAHFTPVQMEQALDKSPCKPLAHVSNTSSSASQIGKDTMKEQKDAEVMEKIYM